MNDTGIFKVAAFAVVLLIMGETICLLISVPPNLPFSVLTTLVRVSHVYVCF